MTEVTQNVSQNGLALGFSASGPLPLRLVGTSDSQRPILLLAVKVQVSVCEPGWQRLENNIALMSLRSERKELSS